MATDKPNWSPDDEEGLKDLIRETIKAAGPLDPKAMPSKIKDRLRGRASGDLDLDAYIAEVLAEGKAKS